jgi:hypothetical protein
LLGADASASQNTAFVVLVLDRAVWLRLPVGPSNTLLGYGDLAATLRAMSAQ